VLFDRIVSVYFIFEKYIYISALEMASPGNRHCANCIGTLSFPVKSGHAVTPRYDRRKFVTLSGQRRLQHAHRDAAHRAGRDFRTFGVSFISWLAAWRSG